MALWRCGSLRSELSDIANGWEQSEHYRKVAFERQLNTLVEVCTLLPTLIEQSDLNVIDEVRA